MHGDQPDSEESRLTVSRVNRLGRRLRQAAELSARDLEELQSLRLDHFEMLADVQAAIRAVDRVPTPTSRLKTVQTIIEKLKRERTMSLSRMQDIAGTRIVEDMTRPEQDVLVSQLCDALRPIGTLQVIDRRRRPSHGYRAVHVVVARDRRFVEVQVRTQLQNQWAQLVERLGDAWGRQIRYGESPVDGARVVAPNTTREDFWKIVLTFAETVDHLEVLMADASVHPTDADVDELQTMQRQFSDVLQNLHDLASELA